MQVDRPARVARGCDGDERDHDRIGEPARDPDQRIEPAEQQRVRVQVEIESEHACQRDGQRLDAPAHLRQHAPHDLLDQHQSEHGQRTVGEVARRADRASPIAAPAERCAVAQQTRLRAERSRSRPATKAALPCARRRRPAPPTSGRLAQEAAQGTRTTRRTSAHRRCSTRGRHPRMAPARRTSRRARPGTRLPAAPPAAGSLADSRAPAEQECARKASITREGHAVAPRGHDAERIRGHGVHVTRKDRTTRAGPARQCAGSSKPSARRMPRRV